MPISSIEKVTFEVFMALENATYQAFINTSLDLIAPEDFYDLDSMRNGIDLRQDRIYIAQINGKLAYSMVTPDNLPVTDVLTNIDAPADLFGQNWTPEKSLKLKKLLAIEALKNGHIQSNPDILFSDPLQTYLSELRTRLSPEDYNETLFTKIYQNAFHVDRDAQTQFHSHTALSYRRNIGKATGSPLQLWINRDTVMKLLNEFYGKSDRFLNCKNNPELYEQYIKQSKLQPLLHCSTNPGNNAFQNGYLSSYDERRQSGNKPFQDMALALELKDISFRSNHNQPIPLSQFLLDLLKAIVSMHVIPVVGVLAVVSFVATGTVAFGLAAGGLYALGVLAQPCYQRFFGESPQSKALRQKTTPAGPIDIAQVFQDHFVAAIEVEQLANI